MRPTGAVPRAAEPAQQVQPDRGVARAPVERRCQAVVEELDVVDDGVGVERGRLRLEPIHPERQMRVSDRIELTGDADSIERVRPQRLQQPVVLLPARSLFRHHEVLVDQPAHHVEHGHGFDVAERRRDSLRSLHREDPGEDAEAAEHDLLALVQPVVAPFHRRGQRLLAGEDGAGASCEEMEAIVELEGDSLNADIWRQRAAASSSASGMPSRRWQICAIAGAFASSTTNVGRARRGAVDEQPDCLVLRERGHRHDGFGGGSRE